jgi:multicomponent Na+:H+ antiporter subunit F
VSPDGAGVLPAALGLAMAMLSLALLLAFVRLVRGPSLPDRVVALELVATTSVGVIAAYDVLTGLPVFLDVAMVLALVGFLGSMAYARYIQRSAGR